jgi:isoleucyl-tRNA synthetase
MYGEDDYNLGDKIGLPKVHTVDEAGKFNDEVSAYGLTGRFVKSAETEKIIIEHLTDSNLLFKQVAYEHDYPFCWRCDTPLLYYAKDSWFIKMTELKEQLIANNKNINWVPDHIKEGRFGEWLANVKDWAISRERYWGTPLPIWECTECDHIEVVDSLEKLGALSGQTVTLESDIHRPAIDNYHFTCSKCGKSMNRVKEVFDCWFDSGAMPFAQQHYPFANKELVDGGAQYPADFICEAIDQTRGWFYTLLAVSTLLGKGSAYKNVICLGHINDKFGKKMSKSKGNVINPWDVISQYGVDAVRQHMYTINQPGEGKRYDLDDVKDVFRQNIMLLWNVYKFYAMYAGEVKGDIVRPVSSNILDKWILIKLDKLASKIGSELEQYHIYEAAREIPLFIDELSTWYLRRSRDRFKSEDEVDKQSALLTTRYVLSELAKVIAPFMPFIAENLWQQVSGHNFTDNNQSVHLSAWPQEQKIGESEQMILDNMILVRRAVELGLAKRDEAGIKIRQMLNSATVKSQNELAPEYHVLATDELNIKSLVWQKGEGEMALELDVVITPELKQEGLKREVVRFINMKRKDAGLSLEDRITVYFQTEYEDLKNAINTAKNAILKDTLSNDIIEGEGETPAQSVKIDGQELKLALKKD